QAVDVFGHPLEALDHATFTNAQQPTQHSFVPYGSKSPASPILGDEQDRTVYLSTSGQANQSVVIGVPPVDPGGPLGLAVVEQEEVVADELHLVERVVDRHRLVLVFLGADHPTRLVVAVG